MSSLNKLVNLRKLDVSRTIVTDRGLSDLKDLTKLEELVLGKKPMANGAALKEFLPHLKIR